MRALLKVFVLATAAVAWASGTHMPAPARAAPRCALPAPVAEYACAPLDVPHADEPAEHAEPPAAEPGQRTAEIEVARVEVPIADAVPVDVIVVDGENGDVLRSEMSAVDRGPERSVSFDIAPPDGYVADSVKARRFKSYISRRAERVRVVEPLRREADVRLRVVDLAGRPVEAARVTEVLRGGEPPCIVALASEEVEDKELAIPEEEPDLGAHLPLARAEPSGTDGWTRIRGIPHLLDERYWIIVGKGRAEGLSEVLLGGFRERHVVEVRLPPASARPLAAESGIGISGGCGGGHRCSWPPRYTPATLEVLVRLKDGRLGAGVRVFVGRSDALTDCSGRALFEGLRPGAHDVDVRDPDFVWSREPVELRDGEWRSIVLSERAGWMAQAVLLDSTGRVVPFARVLVESFAPVEYLRVEDGVQDLVYYTDLAGRISFPAMHHHLVTLTFRYGSRSQQVTLHESDPFGTVQLPPP